MTARTALTLRLLGPLIEVVCLILWLRVRDQGRTLAGIPVEYPIYAGLAVGFTLVLIGLAFSRPHSRPPRDSD
jgi:hypothetical protein